MPNCVCGHGLSEAKLIHEKGNVTCHISPPTNHSMVAIVLSPSVGVLTLQPQQIIVNCDCLTPSYAASQLVRRLGHRSAPTAPGVGTSVSDCNSLGMAMRADLGSEPIPPDTSECPAARHGISIVDPKAGHGDGGTVVRNLCGKSSVYRRKGALRAK